MFEDLEALEKEVQSFRDNMLASEQLVKGITEIAAQAKEQSKAFSAASKNLEQQIAAQSQQLEKGFKEETDAAVAQIIEKNETFLTGASESIVKAEQEAGKRIAHESELIEKLASETNAHQKAVESSTKLFRETVDSQTAAAQEERKALQESYDAQTKALEDRMQEITASAVQELQQSNEKNISDLKESFHQAQQAYEEQTRAAQAKMEQVHTSLNEKYQSVLNRLEAANLEQTLAECRRIRKSLNVKFAVLLIGLGGILATIIWMLLK